MADQSCGGEVLVAGGMIPVAVGVDDILDISGNEEVAGKTLGKDQERGKTTAITATKNAPADPIEYVDSLLETSSDQLSAWPELQASWDAFLNVTMKPVLSKHLSAR